MAAESVISLPNALYLNLNIFYINILEIAIIRYKFLVQYGNNEDTFHQFL